MAAYLLKTEPNEYSFEDLERDGQAEWDGVKNALAQQHLRSMRRGDRVFVYHTGRERRVVGTARVVRAPYPDPNDARLALVDLAPERRLGRPVPLDEIRREPAFADSPLVRIGRLSVVPLTREQERVILRLAGGRPGRSR